jgi:hypothetical protein
VVFRERFGRTTEVCFMHAANGRYVFGSCRTVVDWAVRRTQFATLDVAIGVDETGTALAA